MAHKVFSGGNDSLPSSGAKSSPSKGVDHGYESRTVSGGSFRAGGDTRPSSMEKQSGPEGGKLPEISKGGRVKETKFG